VQREWWYHRLGCEAWFLAERDTTTNDVVRTEVPAAVGDEGAPAPEAAAVPDSPAV
jgi:sarcosine oxidase delta subunit